MHTPQKLLYISPLRSSQTEHVECITISAGRRRRLLDRDGIQEADLFNAVEGKICCFVWIDVALEKSAECRARLSGGINTQSHIGCSSDIEQFTNSEMNFNTDKYQRCWSYIICLSFFRRAIAFYLFSHGVYTWLCHSIPPRLPKSHH